MTPATITSGSLAGGWLTVRTGAAVLMVLTFALFAPALRYDYLQYDDGVYVYENAHVLKGLSAEGFLYAFRSIDGGSWMPLTWLSLMLDQSLFGNHPWGHHLTNILLHSLCAALLFIALHKLTQRFGASWFVAAAFAFHPLRTESVVWIAERKDVLSGVFWMLGMLAYSRYAERRSATGFSSSSRPKLVTDRRSSLGVVLVCLMLGLMSKPMLVTFPFVLLLLDVWPLRRVGDDWKTLRSRLWPLVREKAWLFAIVLVFCGLTFWSQDKSGAVSRPPTSVAEKISAVVASYGFYLQQNILPSNRTVLYPDVIPTTRESRVNNGSPLTSSLSRSDGERVAEGRVRGWRAFDQSSVALGISRVEVKAVVLMIVVIAMTMLAPAVIFHAPWFTVGWLWFIGTLVPVIGIVRVGYTTVADRYTYLPSIGLFVIVAWAAGRIAANRLWLQRVFATLAVVLVGLMMIATRNDLPRWKDSGALFASAVQVSPHRVAWNNLAYFQIGRGEYTQAIESCNRAIEMNPEYGQTYGNRSLAYAWLDDYESAKADYDQAVKLGTRPIQPMRNRVGGNSAVPSTNDPEEAWHLFATLFKLEPRRADSFRGRADMRFKLNDVSGALVDYNKAIQLDPNDERAHTSRGNAHVSSGNWLAALADLSKVIELSPTNAASYQNRAVVYFKTQHYDQAWRDIDQCKKLGGTPHESFLHALSEASGRKP